MAESVTARTIEQCRRCSLNNARGEEITYEDGVTIFKCDACGKTMYMGEIEEAHTKTIEHKRGRERAQANRERYQNEVFDKVAGEWKTGKVENMGDLPDIDEAYEQIVNPTGAPQEDFDYENSGIA